MHNEIKIAEDTLSTEEVTRLSESSPEAQELTDSDLKQVIGAAGKWGGNGYGYGYGYGQGGHDHGGYGYGYGYGQGGYGYGYGQGGYGYGYGHGGNC
ncbi:hypothetical protein [Dictyobacter kobayashii]|uniref:Uncharacterized protein n=1 Tax=Dictyobacter kobayashii TaxID=2014872 RepID=A0A402AR04_9CHLR|nr:hypothetical protein [Dictyobacter kobayashii]GCE21530.1 hypothetical protein KDK_53300 [Dictyobacter kobayashii]